MEVYGYIYCIFNPVNGKRYIGQTTRSDWMVRVREHAWPSAIYPIDQAIKKYGLNHFDISCIGEAYSKDGLDIMEMAFIELFSTMKRISGYNMKEGGSKGKLTDTARKKIGIGNKGKVLSKEHIERLKASVKGKSISEEHKAKVSAANTGKRHSLESKIKMSNSHKGKKLSDEIKEKLSIVRKGRIVSQDTRDKLSKALKGNKNSLGHIPTPETLEKMRNSKIGYKHSPDTLKKLSISHTGKKASPETCEKMRVLSTGRRHSAESCEKMRLACKNRRVSEETKTKMRKRKHTPETIAKIVSSKKGIPWSKDIREKMMKARKAASFKIKYEKLLVNQIQAIWSQKG